MIKTTRGQFVGIVLSSAVLPAANRLAGADNPAGVYVRTLSNARKGNEHA
jgi:hypothetical protein